MAQTPDSPFEDHAESLEFCMVESQINQSAAAIKSMEQLQQWLASKPAGSHAFGNLGEKARGQFMASLIWNDEGLSSFSLEPLVADLTLSEAYSVLSLFGSQTSLAAIADHFKLIHEMDCAIKARLQSMECSGSGDLFGFHCKRRATCEAKTNHVCRASC